MVVKKMLNEEQKKLVESSIWVVNTALKKQGYEKDKDLKQEALLYMCKCAERFDEKKGVKWTTYAFKNVYLFIKRTKAKEQRDNKFIANDDLFSLNECDIVDYTNEEMYNNTQYKIEKLMSVCSKQEKEILKRKMCGYSHLEIAQQMNCSSSKINMSIRAIQERVK